MLTTSLQPAGRNIATGPSILAAAEQQQLGNKELPGAAAMSRILRALDAQSSVISALQARLGTVCEPSASSNGESAPAPTDAIYSPMTGSLHGIAQTIELGNLLLGDLLKRLEF